MKQRYRFKQWPVWALALVMIFGVSSLTSAQDYWINLDFTDFSSGAYGNYTESITVNGESENIVLTDVNKTPTGTGSGLASTGFFQFRANSIIEFPEVPNVGTIRMVFEAFGAGRSNQLQVWNSATSSWDLVQSNSGIGTTGVEFIVIVNSDQPKRYRITGASHAQKIHDFSISEFTEDPIISSSTSTLSNFSYRQDLGGPSDSQSFTFEGSNLDPEDATITISAPANFEVSLNDSDFGNSRTVTASSGSVSETTVYVRMVSGLEADDYSGNITISGGDADNVTVSVSGTVNLPPPALTALDDAYTQNFADFVSLATLPNGWALNKNDFTYRGAFSSSTTTGGIYGDGAIGIVQTGTAPNTDVEITLTLFNDTGVEIEALDISYEGLVSRLDVSGNPSWAVSVNGSAVSQLSYSASEEESRVVSYTVTGLSIANGATFTIVWSTERQGTAAQKKLGFTDVSVTAIEPPALVTPELSVATGTYFANQTVSVNNFDAIDGADGTIYYTLDGSTPTASSNEYDNTTGILIEDGNGAVTLRVIAISGTEESAIAQATYTFPVNVADIAGFRGGSNGVLYRITGEVTVLHRNSFRNRHFVRDSSGSLTIWDEDDKIVTEYEDGDNVSGFVGTRSTVNSGAIIVLNAAADPGEAESSGNDTSPVLITLDNLDLSYTGNLVQIENVEFTSTGTFANGTNYDITDPSLEGTLVFRTDFFSMDYIGTAIPEELVNLTAIVFGIGSNVQLVARSLDDFESATKSVTITGNAGWRMLSLPVNDVAVSALGAQNWIQGIAGENAATEDGNPNFYFFNDVGGANEGVANAWQAPANMSSTIASGQGFIWYLYESTTAPSKGFPFTLSVSGISPTEDLTFTRNINTSFYLLGNPYNGTLSFSNVTSWGSDLQNTVRTWNPAANDNAGGWTAVTEVGPFTSVIIEQSNMLAGEFTIPVASAVTMLEETTVSKVRLNLFATSLDGRNLDDNEANFEFREDARIGWDSYDASYLQSLSGTFANLALIGPKDDEEVLQSVKSLPLHFEGALDIPLAVLAYNTEEKMTISLSDGDLPDNWSFILTDRTTGDVINLREESYEFLNNDVVLAERKKEDILSQDLRVAANDVNARFIITVSNTQPTSTEFEADIPMELTLSQNYPNPFNPTTVLSFGLPQSEMVRLTIYDIMGRQVAVLVNGEMAAGNHQVTFDASRLASGMYVYRLQAGTKTMTRTMTLIK